jgi:branched-chain amino acid aminotransferase
VSVVWIDGALVGADEARVSPFDHGMVVGDGAFETMKVVDGLPFALSRHLRRLNRSLAGLGVTPPDEDALRTGVHDVVAANQPGVGRLRITVTSGVGPLGSNRDRGVRPTITVLTGPPATWESTAAVVVCPWVRNERSAVAGLKTTSYAENAVALAWANERGASEALFANTVGRLCEGTGTNVFVAFGGRLVTPPLSSGCLAGVTRELLLELGAAEEADVPIDALGTVEEACLTSSTRDVQPISLLDGRPLDPSPGPVTRAALEAFADLQARTLDP